MNITQHIPNYCDGFEPKQATFNSTKDLLNVEWVKFFSEQKDFYRYSISDNNLLMAEFDEGYKWSVVGRLLPTVSLPKWEAKYRPPTFEEIEAKQKQMETEQKRQDEFNQKYKTENMKDYLSSLETIVFENLTNIM